MKKILTVLAAFLAMAVLAGAATYGLANRYINARLVKQWEAPVVSFTVSTDPAVVERGRHLTQTVLLCAQCHDDDLGGMEPYIDAAGVITVNTPNITRGKGSIVADYSASDIARILRYGVRPDGTGVMVMGANNWIGLSDTDLTAIVSYLDTVPDVERTTAKSYIYPAGRLLWYFGVFDLQPVSIIDFSETSPSTTPTTLVEHGAYLARVASCLECHGATGSGGAQPGAPADMAVPRNLTPHETGLKGWTRKDFATALQAGRSKDGAMLGKEMPWRKYAGLKPDEVDALWAFVQTLPAKEYGGR